MYCDYFGLSREPFSIAPDPAFIYPSKHHRQALAHLKYGLEREGGFLLLTGEVGTGKTTLVRLLLEQIPASFRIAYVLNATLDRLDVLASICQELGLEVGEQPRSAKVYVDLINADLLKAHAEGRKTLVVIEEAQNLSADVLEMLRLLTNLETNTTKLLHILLVGQPELLDIIALPELRQLNQRIVSRFHLEPLDRSETEQYLNHRLAKAGCSRPLFESAAVRRLHQLADGVPRKLNLIAERALLGAYAESRDRVGVAQVAQARQEVFGKLQRGKSVASLKVLMAFILIVVVASGALYYWSASTPATEVVAEASPATLMPVAEPVAAVPSEPQTEAEPAVVSMPTAPVQQSLYSGLLARWSVAHSAESVAELCAVAFENNLLCVEQSLGSLTELQTINRPMVVELDSQPTLLLDLSGGQARVVRASGEEVIPQSEFTNRWNGEVVYLWKPPLGYSDSVRVGDRNSTVVGWLLSQLQYLDPQTPTLITGGNYSQAVADAVAAFQRSQELAPDGVLGQKTLMKINELLGNVPVLNQVAN